MGRKSSKKRHYPTGGTSPLTIHVPGTCKLGELEVAIEKHMDAFLNVVEDKGLQISKKSSQAELTRNSV
jgi:hypothetical protein